MKTRKISKLAASGLLMFFTTIASANYSCEIYLNHLSVVDDGRVAVTGSPIRKRVFVCDLDLAQTGAPGTPVTPDSVIVSEKTCAVWFSQLQYAKIAGKRIRIAFLNPTIRGINPSACSIQEKWSSDRVYQIQTLGD